MKRPIGIILVAIWFFLNGTSTAIGGGIFSFVFADALRWLGFAAALTAIPSATFQSLQILFILIGVILIASGLGYWISGVGLLQGREWGRVGGILSAVSATLGWFAIGIALFVFLGGLLVYPAIFGIVYGLFHALPILYLVSGEARHYCRGAAAVSWTGAMVVEQTAATAIGAPVPGTQRTAATVPAPVASYQPSPTPALPGTAVIGAPQPPSAWLVGRIGNRPGKEMPLRRDRNTIGRDGTQCDIVVDDVTISKRHAEIRFENGQYVLYDLASTNGTFVNRHRVQRQSLLDGDQVQLGNVSFVFKEVKLRPRN